MPLAVTASDVPMSANTAIHKVAQAEWRQDQENGLDQHRDGDVLGG